MAQSHDIEVNWEDQQRICAFGRLNTRSHELSALLKLKQKHLEDTEEAEAELMLADENSCELVIGECFCEIENENCEEKLGEIISKQKGEIEKYRKELKTVSEAMDELKKVLYEKFGQSINLEE